MRSSTSRSASASRTSRKASVLEVAQPAMDELGGGRRSAGGEVALLDQQHLEAAAGGIARDAGAVDAAADDGEIEFGHAKLGFLRAGQQGAMFPRCGGFKAQTLNRKCCRPTDGR